MSNNEAPTEHPTKRRKISTVPSSSDDLLGIFSSLFGGTEGGDLVRRRYQLFQELWSTQKEKIDQLLSHAHSAVVADIAEYVKLIPPSDGSSGISTGLIVTGPSGALPSRLLEQRLGPNGSETVAVVIHVDSSNAPNLVTLFKNIIRNAITQVDGYEGYHSFLREHRKLIPMSYDLELLQKFVKRKGIQRVLISITDVESFDMSLFPELVSVLDSWKDRIQFAFLLGISTTVELFETRLSKSTIRMLDGRVFHSCLQGDIFHAIYSLVQGTPGTNLWHGPTVSNVLLERSHDQDETPQSFTQAIKYTYMSHFFANPLSVLLSEHAVSSPSYARVICEAIRNTESFRRYAEELLENGKAREVKNVLSNDKVLLKAARQGIELGQDAMKHHHQAVGIFKSLRNWGRCSPITSPSDFEIDAQALSGVTFHESQIYSDTLSAVRKMSSKDLTKLLANLLLAFPMRPFPFENILENLSVLHKNSTDDHIRSAHDPACATASTRVTKHNTVSLAKHAPKLTASEKKYTAIVNGFVSDLEAYFEASMINPTSLFMHEAFLYDLKSPLSGAFTPRPRYAVERALDRPGDYLGCECCTNGGGGMNDGTALATSVLWQLWCEAGSIVNVRDLWEAFGAIVINDRDEAEDLNGSTDGKVGERMALALFYRGLAELRMMGFLKVTKKKVDCLAKIAWRGL